MMGFLKKKIATSPVPPNSMQNNLIFLLRNLFKNQIDTHILLQIQTHTSTHVALTHDLLFCLA